MNTDVESIHEVGPGAAQKLRECQGGAVKAYDQTTTAQARNEMLKSALERASLAANALLQMTGADFTATGPSDTFRGYIDTVSASLAEAAEHRGLMHEPITDSSNDINTMKDDLEGSKTNLNEEIGGDGAPPFIANALENVARAVAARENAHTPLSSAKGEVANLAGPITTAQGHADSLLTGGASVQGAAQEILSAVMPARDTADRLAGCLAGAVMPLDELKGLLSDYDTTQPLEQFSAAV